VPARSAPSTGCSRRCRRRRSWLGGAQVAFLARRSVVSANSTLTTRGYPNATIARRLQPAPHACSRVWPSHGPHAHTRRRAPRRLHTPPPPTPPPCSGFISLSAGEWSTSGVRAWPVTRWAHPATVTPTRSAASQLRQRISSRQSARSGEPGGRQGLVEGSRTLFTACLLHTRTYKEHLWFQARLEGRHDLHLSRRRPVEC
jgi:hypothetical protein